MGGEIGDVAESSQDSVVGATGARVVACAY
jgi:hypothetical protein